LDIVDSSGKVVGQELRSKCHGDPSLSHRAVHIFVRNRRGEIFLQKRSIRKDIQPGKWDTSVGGHLEVGENYEMAALRELEEELGADLTVYGGIEALERRHDYVWKSAVETEHIRTYEVVLEGPFRLHPDEIEEGRFWTEDELRSSLGTGSLTPNLEEELGLLGIIESSSPVSKN
jgi:isopentenyldiphosphate isomerase